jgi:hypothetical protein
MNYVGQSENKFPHSISGDRVELVGFHCVLCPQAAFFVCCGTYELHRAGGAGAMMFYRQDNGRVRARQASIAV